MTRLLVSVRSAEEALAAIAGGADLIDVKEPLAGSLGAAMPHVWQAVSQAVGALRPLSAALGELNASSDTRDFSALVGYSFAKLGLSACKQTSDWERRWQAILAQLPERVAPVAVAYADHVTAESPRPASVCTAGHRLGCRGLLIDTFAKHGGSLFDLLSRNELLELLDQARSCGMTTVLAGSLRLEQLDEVLELRPDYVAVRGAVCRNSRAGQLDSRLVRNWAECCHHDSVPALANPPT